MQTVGIPLSFKEQGKDWHLAGFRDGFRIGRICGLEEAADFITSPSTRPNSLNIAAEFLRARVIRLKKV